MDPEKTDMKEYLYSLRNMGAKLGLERVEKLVKELENPQNEFKSILIGGSSGKGSTVAMLSSILKEGGYKVGMFTSPHLSNLTERIRINGEMISEKDLVRIVGMIKNTIEKMKEEEGFEHPTFFEIITTAAFCYFKEQKVDFAVLEVGLGGRLDATNVTSPVLSIITHVSLEHTKILGDTIEKIANEKAGIIHENITLITAADNEAVGVFEARCKEKNSKMLRVGEEIKIDGIDSDLKGQKFKATVAGKTYNELFIPLLGTHQLKNAGCALGAVYALGMQNVKIPDHALSDGLRNVKWPGRFEIMQQKPLVVLDCAKDPDAMKKLGETIGSLRYNRLITIISISSDKNIKEMIEHIAHISDVVIITVHKVMGRAADPTDIEKQAKEYGKETIVIEDVKEAVRKALELADEKDMVLITGSLFTVGEAREIWIDTNPTLGRELNEIPKR